MSEEFDRVKTELREKLGRLFLSGYEEYKALSERKRREQDSLFRELYPERCEQEYRAGLMVREFIRKHLDKVQNRLEWLNPPADDIEPYPKIGEYPIEGLTREEYESWIKAGIPFDEEEFKKRWIEKRMSIRMKR